MESLWTSETAAETEPQPAEQTAEAHAEQAEGDNAAVAVASTVTLAVSSDDFSALEERVLRAVELLKHERQARASAEVRVAEAEERVRQTAEQLGPLETQLREQSALAEQLQSEIATLRAERDTVRQRVERLLGQLDALEI